MDITVAIRLADEWRKTDACSTSAKVAVALLNELERKCDLDDDQTDALFLKATGCDWGGPFDSLRRFVDYANAAADVAARRGVLPVIPHDVAFTADGAIYGITELKRLAEDAQCVISCLDVMQIPKTAPSGQDYSLWGRVRLFAEGTELLQLAQAQSKVNDDMLAAQRNLLLREDGYPNAPTKS